MATKPEVEIVGHDRKYGGGSLNCGAISHRSIGIFTSGVMAAILNFGSLSSSSNVDQYQEVSCVKSKSGMVEKFGTAFGIALQFPIVQKCFAVPRW